MRPLTPPRRFIAVDRARHTLELWRRPRLRTELALVKRWDVAVGMDDYPTTRGLYLIDDRDYLPSWTLPNSQWVRDAGLEPYTVVPYGDPRNPIRGRWLGLKDAEGVGIHGTADTASLGKDASHGCIRMAIDSIEELFPEAPLNTPVYIA